MRPYETLVVLGAEVGDKSSQLLQRLEGIIKDGGGTIDVNHDWGNRKLAYPIKKQTHGHYYLIEYTSEPAAVKELERTLRITDGVLRFMSVQQEHTGLPEPRHREEAPPPRESRSLSELRTPGVNPQQAAPPDSRQAAAPQEQASPPKEQAPAPEQAAPAEQAAPEPADETKETQQ